MANEKQPYVPVPDRVVSSTTPPTMQERDDALAQLTNALATGITEAVRLNSPPRHIAFGDYKSTNARNPTGKTAAERELPCLFYQNGDRVRERKLNDEELSLIPHLSAGTYVDGLVRVQTFEKDGRPAFNLVYKNKEIADRMAMKGAAPRLVDMLRRCVQEAGSLSPIASTL